MAPACNPTPCYACREDSPEAFHHELENAAWEESLRGCAESTYLALFEVRCLGLPAQPPPYRRRTSRFSSLAPAACVA